MFGRVMNKTSHVQPYGHLNPNVYVHPFYMGTNDQYYMRQQPVQNYNHAAGQYNSYYSPFNMEYQHPQQLAGMQQSYPHQAYPQQHFDPAYYSHTGSKNAGIFQNPLESEDYYGHQPSKPAAPQMPYMNPYPKQSFIQKQPSGVQSIMNSFKAQDGSLDINKMVDTAGQMMSAVTQVSSMVKGIGGIFKS
ncbi:YppG family protein [Cytobacillus sp. FSL R5-0377]|uniref:YppG family protein n=2 Tax=unclassified Cytobacillus TaxID=2675268 RepID=UPI00135A9898|nr:hypothetical protein KIS4809_2469 [Bacillus sp. ZZV12-4809]MCM3091269.1 YppG family protein [Cytobacillus sp. AMY 15.2]